MDRGKEQPKLIELFETIDDQAGYFRVIYYLYTHLKGHINKMSGDLSMGNETLYRIFNILSRQNIVIVRKEKGKTRAIRKNYYLTDKGKEVARTLVKLGNIIRDMPTGEEK